MSTQRILVGDCRERLAEFEPDTFSACVTDPPYELGFMGKTWDKSGVAFDPETWRAVYRVLKPGAHLLAFGGTRTVHRMTCAIEDAGFEIRDTLCWLYGSGFPKSLDVSKAIDKSAGEIGTFGNPKSAAHAGWIDRGRMRGDNGHEGHQRPWMQDPESVDRNAREYIAATDAAREWDGWGTALKPAYESIVWAQKPYDLRHYCGIMAPTMKELLCQFRSHAKDADASSQSSPNGSDEASDSVLWNAVAQSSTPDDLYGLTDTLRSEWEMVSTSNIAWSWLSILGAVWRHANTFTTETASSLITDLKTLNSLLSTITLESIVQDEIRINGGESSAWLADSIFSGVHAKLLCTLGASAAGPATSSDGATGLRPDCSFIIVARKPFRGTVAANVQKHGTGAINVDACRIALNGEQQPTGSGDRRGGAIYAQDEWTRLQMANGGNETPPLGRWPANVILDEESARLLDEQSGETVSKQSDRGEVEIFKKPNGWIGQSTIRGHNDSGGPSRFFYTSKASTTERNAGLHGMPGEPAGRTIKPSHGDRFVPKSNPHPTVKPLDLMQWLVRLVTPPGGIVLDPFAGSGSTGVACDREGVSSVLIELSPEYAEIARKRIYGDAPMFAKVGVA